MSEPNAHDRPSSDRVQGLSRSLVAGLYMLIRSVKLYDPENAVFQRPLAALLETANLIVAKEGQLELSVAQGSFYLNAKLVRIEQASLENVKFLIGEMEARKVGGFKLIRPATLQELKNFIWIFSKDQNQEAGEDGLDGRKLTSMKLSRWTKLKERLADEPASTGQIDRKKYALTVYARAIFFIDLCIQQLRADKPLPPPTKAARVIQELVDVSFEFPTQFLGMTTSGSGDRILSHHLVNTALVAIAFGGGLGLTKAQLKDLAVAALFNEITLCRLPEAYLLRVEPEKLPKEGIAALQGALREGARMTLAETGAARLHFLRAISSLQMLQPFGKPTRDTAGRITLVVPLGDPLFFSRILTICSYFDNLTSNTAEHAALGAEVALNLMWNQQRFRFDPELLTAFVRVMSRIPVKALDSRGPAVLDIAGI